MLGIELGGGVGYIGSMVTIGSCMFGGGIDVSYVFIGRMWG